MKVRDLSIERAALMNDNAHVTPLAMLKHVVRLIEEGEMNVDHLLMVMIDRGESKRRFEVHWRAAQITKHEAIAGLEILKNSILSGD